MNLYLLRHGIAEEQAKSGGPDCERRLTDKGRRRVREIARAMRGLKLEFDLVSTSPFPRARETAEIVTQVLGLKRRLQTSEALAIPPSSARLIEQLRAARPAPRSVLLVGHEPHLSSLASLLLTGSEAMELRLKKGGLCQLEVAELQTGRCASLAWLLTPGQMRRMA